MDIDVRAIRPDEFDAFRRVDQVAFQFVPKKSDPPEPDTWARGDLDRAFGAFASSAGHGPEGNEPEGNEMVGIGRNYTFDLTVPGGARIPAGAVSWIGVSPTHRRRGVLTSIMAALAEDSRAHGEPVSILTASEGAIYRRFGYGVAVDRVGCTIERAHGAFVPNWSDPGRVRFVEQHEAEKIFPAVYEGTRHSAGSVARPEFWWPEVLFGYHAEAKFSVVHETNGEADGFVLYSVTGDWSGGIHDRTIEVIDLQATNDTARLALWRYLLDVDLVKRVKAHHVPLDDPLRWALADLRHRRVEFVNDGLYLKVLDVAATLEARSYQHDGVLRFAVRGDQSYELRVERGRATCGPTTGPAEVDMDHDVLGALVMGARRLGNFVAAGGASGDPVAISFADRLFTTAETPATLSAF